MVVPPMGLNEDTVDLREVDGFGSITNGLQQTGEAEVPGPADDAFGGTNDEGERFRGERVVSEPRLVQFREYPSLHVVGRDLRHDDGVGDAALDVLIVAQADTSLFSAGLICLIVTIFSAEYGK